MFSRIIILIEPNKLLFEQNCKINKSLGSLSLINKRQIRFEDLIHKLHTIVGNTVSYSSNLLRESNLNVLSSKQNKKNGWQR